MVRMFVHACAAVTVDAGAPAFHSSLLILSLVFTTFMTKSIFRCIASVGVDIATPGPAPVLGVGFVEGVRFDLSFYLYLDYGTIYYYYLLGMSTYYHPGVFDPEL